MSSAVVTRRPLYDCQLEEGGECVSAWSRTPLFFASPERGVARFESAEQQEHQAHQQQHVHNVAESMALEESKHPSAEGYESEYDEHVRLLWSHDDLRMAARPSRLLQRLTAAPFNRLAPLSLEYTRSGKTSAVLVRQPYLNAAPMSVASFSGAGIVFASPVTISARRVSNGPTTSKMTTAASTIPVTVAA